METGLRLAAGLAPFWIAHGLIDEGKRSLAAVLAALARAERRTRAGARGRGAPPDARRRSRGGRARLPREPDAVADRRGVVPRRRSERARHGGPLSRPAGTRRDACYDEALALATARGPVVAGRARPGEPRRARRARGPPSPRPWSATSRPSRSRARAATRGWSATCLTNAGRAVRQLGDLDRAERPAGRGASHASSRSRTPGASPSAWTRSPLWPRIAGTTSGRPACTAPRRRSGSGPGSRSGPRSAPSTRPACERRRPRSATPPGRARAPRAAR